MARGLSNRSERPYSVTYRTAASLPRMTYETFSTQDRANIVLLGLAQLSEAHDLSLLKNGKPIKGFASLATHGMGMPLHIPVATAYERGLQQWNQNGDTNKVLDDVAFVKEQRAMGLDDDTIDDLLTARQEPASTIAAEDQKSFDTWLAGQNRDTIGTPATDDPSTAHGPGRGLCHCGCGASTVRPKSRFLPGHDAKLKSRLLNEAMATGEKGVAGYTQADWDRQQSAVVQLTNLGWLHFLQDRQARTTAKATGAPAPSARANFSVSNPRTTKGFVLVESAAEIAHGGTDR